MKLETGFHTIVYSTPTRVLVSIDDQPVGELPPGSGTFKIRGKGGKLTIDPPKAKVQMEVISKKASETVDDVPPPQPAPPPNYLAALRDKVRQSMGVTREAFADFQSIYEVHEGLDVFEEDRVNAPENETNEPLRQLDTSANDQNVGTTTEVSSE